MGVCLACNTNTKAALSQWRALKAQGALKTGQDSRPCLLASATALHLLLLPEGAHESIVFVRSVRVMVSVLGYNLLQA